MMVPDRGNAYANVFETVVPGPSAGVVAIRFREQVTRAWRHKARKRL